MRIALIITEMNPGGAERCLTEIAIGLTESGDDVRVYSFGSHPIKEKSIFAGRLEENRVPVEYFGLDSSWKFLSAKRMLTERLRAFKPTLAQTFLFHANVIGTLASVHAGVGIRVAGVRVAEANAVRCRIERHAMKKTQHIVCVSEEVKHFSRKWLGADPNKTSVIPNAVDVSHFSTAQPVKWSSIQWPDDSLVTLFVGRMHKQKGIELLQREIERIAPKNSNRRLLLIGDGPLASSIDKWTEAVGTNRVKRLPWQNDVAKWMKASRVLVLPSHYEGMPNVVLEAMATGLPVVSSNVEGSSALLCHNSEKQLFDSGDSMAMAVLVCQFLENAILCNEIGKLNQQRARNDFSIPTMLDRYRSLYRKLTAQGISRERASSL